MPVPHNQVVKVNDYLTWESCADDRFDFDCPPPVPIVRHLPDWIKNLRGNLQEYLPEGFGSNSTYRHCLGFRGLLDIAYTMPLPVNVGGEQTHFSSGNLHPEMIHDTPFADKPGVPEGGWEDPMGYNLIVDNGVPMGYNNGRDYSPYRYRIKLLFWPWRAKMTPGWRLMIIPNPWIWPTEWQAFAGAPRPNWRPNKDNTGLGEANIWQLPLEPGYNYINIETVLAVKRTHVIPAGTVTFWAIPVYSPDNT